MPTFAFLDSNVFLHYRRPDEIDWPALLEGKDVVLLVAPLVVRELEKHKTFSPVPRIKKRAAEIIRWLGPYVDAPSPDQPLRSGVRLAIVRFDPTIDFAGHHLSREIADDILIASVLEFSQAHPGERVALVSADTGIRLKAPAHGIELKRPPDEFLLPEEADPQAKEIRNLKEQLSAYQRRQPALHVTFPSGRTNQPASRPDVQIPTRDQIEHDLWMAESEARSEYSHVLLGTDEADDAREAVFEHKSARSKYLRALQQARVHRSRTIPLALILENKGTAPASNIDLELTVNVATVSVAGAEQVDPEPPFGQEPYGWRGARDQNAGTKSTSSDEPISIAADSAERQRATFHVPRLKQHDRSHLAPLYVTFPTHEDVCPFSVEYRMTFDEHPDVLTGRLDVGLE